MWNGHLTLTRWGHEKKYIPRKSWYPKTKITTASPSFPFIKTFCSLGDIKAASQELPKELKASNLTSIRPQVHLLHWSRMNGLINLQPQILTPLGPVLTEKDRLLIIIWLLSLLEHQVSCETRKLFSYLWFFDVSFCSKTRGGNSWLTPQKTPSSFQLVVFFKFMHGFGNAFLQGGPLLLVDGNLWPLFKWPEKTGNWCYTLSMEWFSPYL